MKRITLLSICFISIILFTSSTNIKEEPNNVSLQNTLWELNEYEYYYFVTDNLIEYFHIELGRQVGTYHLRNDTLDITFFAKAEYTDSDGYIEPVKFTFKVINDSTLTVVSAYYKSLWHSKWLKRDPFIYEPIKKIYSDNSGNIFHYLNIYYGFNRDTEYYIPDFTWIVKRNIGNVVYGFYRNNFCTVLENNVKGIDSIYIYSRKYPLDILLNNALPNNNITTYNITVEKTYNFFFNNNKYFAINCYLHGTKRSIGEFTNSLIMLWDITDTTNPKHILTDIQACYGTKCFTDINNDGNLDYIQWKLTGNKLDTVNIYSLEKDKFQKKSDQYYTVEKIDDSYWFKIEEYGFDN